MMAAFFVRFLLVGLVGVIAASFDNGDLVQSHLRRDTAASMLQNNSNSTTVEDTWTPKYRVTLQSTWGDDHVCLTELEFHDQLGAVVKTTLEAGSVSSCWGCAVSCGECTVDYGNPSVLFDGDADTAGPRAYFCSDSGSFDGKGENGEVSITVATPTRPHSFALRRPDVHGTAVAKKWTLEENDRNDNWYVIAKVDEQEPEMTQTVGIEASSGPAGRWWEYETAACKSHHQFAETDASTFAKMEYVKISAGTGEDASGWQNNGKGIFFDGSLGAIELDGETYYAKSMHFEFPSNRLVGVEQSPVVGEFHITHQKPDGKGNSHTHQEGVAVVIIPLRLPLERDAPSDTEAWFQNMGLSKLPAEGETKPLANNFSLSDVFANQLTTYNELDCHEKTAGGTVDPKLPRWLVTTKPALITGKVVQAFKDAFPFETTNGDSYERTYVVEGKVEAVNYDKLGRSHLVGRSQKPEVAFDFEAVMDAPVVQITEGTEWVPNAEYVPGCGEFMPYGEWYIPA